MALLILQSRPLLHELPVREARIVRDTLVAPFGPGVTACLSPTLFLQGLSDVFLCQTKFLGQYT